MNVELTRFSVRGLYGRLSFDIPFDENKLILIGENGTGKSTVINLMFYFLTRQWSALKKYDFESISLCINGEDIVVTKEVLSTFIDDDVRFQWDEDYIKRAFWPLQGRKKLLEEIDEDLIQVRSGNMSISVILARLHTKSINTDVVEKHFGIDVVEDLKKYIIWDVANYKLKSLEKEYSALFLPTYRRIEQDLGTIFPELSAQKVSRLRERRTEHEGSSYVELVEFGMEDVERFISNKMGKLKDNIRTILNDLAGEYLRDVIRGEPRSLNFENLASLDRPMLDSILERMGESLLSGKEKGKLKSMVEHIRFGEAITHDDKHIALFLSKLVELHQRIIEEERDIRDFVETCNRYLVGKQLVYEDKEYRISIELEPGLRGKEGPSKKKTSRKGAHDIELHMLSSGEKQIVSLFAQIYLSEKSGYFVIIDEPELSLSVPWQRRFLPDILKAHACSGLIAVTHSPFIYDNDMEKYVRPITEFMEPYDASISKATP